MALGSRVAYPDPVKIIILKTESGSYFTQQIQFHETIPLRVCVALSRAQDGLFILGNLTGGLSLSSAFWAEIGERLAAGRSLVSALQLACVSHGRIMPAATVEDFHQLKAQGRLASCLSKIFGFCGTGTFSRICMYRYKNVKTNTY